MKKHKHKRKSSKPLVLLLVLLAAAIGIGAGIGLAVYMREKPSNQSVASGGGAQTAPTPLAPQSHTPEGEDTPASSTPGEANINSYSAAPLPEEFRGVWIMFLEWENINWSTEDTARAEIAEMYQNATDLGLNTVICHVRPFGDAMYKSDIYPWSHFLTGTQGQDPGYDPLKIMVEEAHKRGLRFEALINPYRVKHSIHGPEALSANNPAEVNPEWTVEYNGNLMYNPGLPQVQELIVKGVAEIVLNYDVDGIHFDDYFYMEGAPEDFDDDTFAQYGGGMGKDEWRRGNINRMVQACYTAAKSAESGASFGISPAGNNENNYNKYHADVKHWLANPGYVDYIMPQIYWGFTHQTQSGRTDAAFDKKCAEWGGYPRHESVRIFTGLGLYRIGVPDGEEGARKELGHGGAGSQEEWETGRNMAEQVQHMRGTGQFSGFALYRYEYMFRPGDTLAAQEAENLKPLLK